MYVLPEVTKAYSCVKMIRDDTDSPIPAGSAAVDATALESMRPANSEEEENQPAKESVAEMDPVAVSTDKACDLRVDRQLPPLNCMPSTRCSLEEL